MKWQLIVCAAAALASCSQDQVTSTNQPKQTDYLALAVSGLSPANMSAWRRARALVQRGQGRASIAALGDSTTAGWGSGGDMASNARVGAWPTLFVQKLAAAGLPARNTSFFGDGGFSDKVMAADPRLTLAANWVGAGKPSAGGYQLVGNSLDGDLRFKPDQPFDTIVVYDAEGPDAAPMTVSADGQELTTIMPPSVKRSGAGRTEVKAPSGSSSVIISSPLKDPSLGQMWVLGIDTYDSATKDVSVWNLGFSGSTTEEWTKAGYPHAPLVVLGQLAPDLTFINLGINDMGRRSAIGAFSSRLRQVALAARKSGSIVLVVPNRIGPAGAPNSLQDQYDGAIRNLSVELHVPVVDLPKLLGTFDHAKAAGLMSDDTHPSAKGYDLIATALSQVALAP